MLKDQGRRRLLAVMFIDMVGYTAMAQRDEALALRVLASQRERLQEIFARHSGRVVKTAGDSFLVVFESTLAAARCALDIQRSVNLTETETGEGARLRVGIHLGDVVEKEGDVLGDTVNVASRIESVAEPGGICVSQQVYDQVRNKLQGCSFERLEGPSLKNVSLPPNVYRVLPRATGAGARLEQRNNRIAVIPLSNFSPNPADSYISDAITDELINSLSKVEGLRVIARTSVMNFRENRRSILEIGESLRVGSVLQGSVLKSGNRIRVSVQLVDVQSEVQFWGEKYDRELSDIFAVQDDIARRVTDSLRVAFVSRERRERRTEDIDAYTHYLRGRTLLYERTESSMKEALRQFEEAAEKDPGYARAYAGMADAHYLLGYFDYIPKREAYAKAKRLATKALSLDGALAEAHATLGAILEHYSNDYAGAEAEFKQAISLKPSYAQAHHWYAITLAAMGRLEEALEQMRVAEECDPLSPQIKTIRGTMLSWAGRDEEALAYWEAVLSTNPDFHLLYFHRAIHYIARGDRDHALADIRRKEKLTPGDLLCIFLSGYAGARFGDIQKTKEAISRLKALSSRKGAVPDLVAHLYASMGDKDSFFEWANRAVDEQAFEPHDVRYSKLYGDIRADPRYRKLLRRIGLTG